ncbi:MAG: hypothetical protein A2Z20_05575 [Bdellovibrionales bacterium RBG_16_40_8]|nr:MAG: hypothetical protein A2Z20_05575 [Bdellovibrionales bacterium RBG_16_40_8]
MMMRSTLVQLICLCIFVIDVWAADPYDIRIRDKTLSDYKTSPFSLFFNPEKNGIYIEKQKIDYDLSQGTVLNLGPYQLDDKTVSLHLTREIGEFYEFDLGLDYTKRVGSIYVMSFRWPVDFVPTGTIEILDDRANSLWRRKIAQPDINDWQSILDEQLNKNMFEKRRGDLEKKIREDSSPEIIKKIKEDLQLARPQNLSILHQHTQFGLANKDFFEMPIARIIEPFRFCISLDSKNSRFAVCSKRYKFVRESGQYKVRVVEKNITPQVLINDKLVTPKGTAIFLENAVPIKFAALLKGGTYFEFVSNPKDFYLVDIINDTENNRINVIGFGDTPMSDIDETFYTDAVNLGILNFLPTIGDLRKFWRARIYNNAKYLYVRGEGGAPFRQTFDFEKLPTTRARIQLSENTTRSTYKLHVPVKGIVNPEIKLSADDTEVERVSPTEFIWSFYAPKSGASNTGVLNVIENGNKWQAEYEIYRGYSAGFGARLSGVATDQAKLILLGEVAGHYWFESLFGWDNYRLSWQRWGVAAKYFQAFLGTDEEIKTFSVGNFDLKYRFTPGVWGRDPTVGLIASIQEFNYGFMIEDNESAEYKVPVVGGGAFWARSMPKFIDSFLNIAPFMRYPKWVDWEFIFYPHALGDKQKSNFMFSMNFHGTIQWRSNFYGEAGFGFKNFSFEDTSSNNPNLRLGSQIGVGYATIGLGFNF